MTWLAEQGTYLSGQEAVDTLDLVALEMERRWGADRLRLLVPEELRTKFDRQRKLTGDAITAGELPDVLRETRRMITAWRALDKVASENPRNILPPTTWEVPLEDGSVAILVQDENAIGAVQTEGRQAAIYTLPEIGRLLSKFPALSQSKVSFPGAVVTAVRQSIVDPLDALT